MFRHRVFSCVLTLMLEALCRAHLAVKLGADLRKQLIEAFTPVARRNRPHPAMAGVHGHYLKWCVQSADVNIMVAQRSSRRKKDQRGGGIGELSGDEIRQCGNEEAGKRQDIFASCDGAYPARKSGVIEG
jgi:hypothetical protein